MVIVAKQKSHFIKLCNCIAYLLLLLIIAWCFIAFVTVHPFNYLYLLKKKHVTSLFFFFVLRRRTNKKKDWILIENRLNLCLFSFFFRIRYLSTLPSPIRLVNKESPCKYTVIPLSITNPIISNNTHKKYNQIANDGIYAVIPNQRVCFSYPSRDLHVATKTAAIFK